MDCFSNQTDWYHKTAVPRPWRPEAQLGEAAPGEAGGGQSYDSWEWHAAALPQVRLNQNLQ